MNMMISIAEKILIEAGISKNEEPEIFNRVLDTLSILMAQLSVQYGMSTERVDIFEKKKASLIEELRSIKNV